MIQLSIIAQLKQNDSEAQAMVFERYSDTLYRVAYRYLRDEMAAEDVMVNGFIKIFDAISRANFTDLSHFEAWMKRIIANEALMILRKNVSFSFVSTSEIEISLVNDDIIDALSAEEIYQLILDLPEGYRTVFNLFALEGYSHQEIAKSLKISEGTSKSQLSKARTLLQRKILALNKSYERRGI